jgi:hypothetical protein
MITAIVRFRLRPGLPLADALDEIREMLPFYNAQEALLHKQISLDIDSATGTSVYLWKDRAAAEAFFEQARPMLAKQTGAEPEIEILDTQVYVNNVRGENIVHG